jgi:hypothetical protein
MQTSLKVALRCRNLPLLRSVGTILPDESIDARKVDLLTAMPDLRSNDIKDKDLVENALGFPAEQLARTVTIKQECKPASQAGRSARHKKWTSTFTFSLLY